MKKIFILVSVIILIILAFLTLRPATFNSGKLDFYFDTLEENDKFMGSVIVLKEGELLYSKTIGFSDVENKIKANENTKYRIGSTSKTFTAVLILKAMEEGKIRLEEKLDKYFPNITNAKKITIENLLNHRSGIYSITSDPNFFSWNTKFKSKEELLSMIEFKASNFEPNSKAYYSNSNYILLTFILEKIYNKPYEKLLEEKITKPLDLNNTYLGKGQTNSSNNEAISYTFVSKNWKNEPSTNLSIPLGAGAIISTSKDLSEFTKALFSGKILKDKTLKQMQTIKDTAGLGLFETTIEEYKAFEHPGVIDGFKTNYIYIPKEDIIFVIITNALDYNLKTIKETVIDALFKKPYEIPLFSSYEVNPKDLDKYVGLYSSPTVNFLKIEITKKDNVLYAQGTGQSKFAFSATDKHKFSIGAIGGKAEFKIDENKMIWDQNGKRHIFTKE